MLPLDSPRWKSVKTFCRSGAELPSLVRSWRDAVGTPKAEEIWDELRDYFLQQLSITNAAYAVIPHAVASLEGVSKRKRLDYLVDIGVAESARLSPGAPHLPKDLGPPYTEAIERAKAIALGLLAVRISKSNFRWLIGTICSLHGHPWLADLLFQLDCLSGECPNCGEVVYPDEIEKSGYC